MTAKGLEVEREPSFEEWSACGEFLKRAEGSSQWWIGDWLNLGEKKYGKTYKAAAEATGLDKQTLRNLKWMSAKFKLSARADNLTFAHHKVVASLPIEKAISLLEKASSDGLTSKDLRDLANQAKNAIEVGAQVESDESCTVADLNALVAQVPRMGLIPMRDAICSSYHVERNGRQLCRFDRRKRRKPFASKGFERSVCQVTPKVPVFGIELTQVVCWQDVFGDGKERLIDVNKVFGTDTSFLLCFWQGYFFRCNLLGKVRPVPLETLDAVGDTVTAQFGWFS